MALDERGSDVGNERLLGDLRQDLLAGLAQCNVRLSTHLVNSKDTIEGFFAANVLYAGVNALRISFHRATDIDSCRGMIMIAVTTVECLVISCIFDAFGKRGLLSIVVALIDRLGVVVIVI